MAESEGTVQEQMARLVTLAEQADGFDRSRVLGQLDALVQSDTAHLLARAELVKALTEAHTLGVPIGELLDDTAAAVVESGPRWWSSPWAVVSAAAVALAPFALVGVLVA